MTEFKQTPSQTVGPYFAYGLTPGQYGYDFSSIADGNMASAEMEGERITLTGYVLDGAGEPISDAIVEIWQPDAQGRFAASRDRKTPGTNFSGFGRCGTGTEPDNRFTFKTVKPGAHSPGHAAYLNMVVMMRGLLSHAFTRVYFSDEAKANAADPVLASVPPDRRDTLLAHRHETPDGVVYRFDIHMQGNRETAFFDL